MRPVIGFIRHVIYEVSLTHCIHHPKDLTARDGSQRASGGPGGQGRVAPKVWSWMGRSVSAQVG